MSKMDMITILPPEIREIILKFLSDEDLWSCLSVNKLWRTCANSNRLWMPHCKILGRNECDLSCSDIDLKFEFSLCYLASKWKRYRLTIGKWKNKKHKSYALPPLCAPRFFSNYDTLVIIDKKSVIGCNIEDTNFPSFEFSLPTSVENLDDIKVLINSNHLIVVHNNIGIIYKKVEEIYEIQSIFSYTQRGNLELTTCNFSQFLKNEKNIDDDNDNINSSSAGLVHSFLSKNKLWVECRNDNDLLHFCTIDIITDEIKAIEISFPVYEVINVNDRILCQSSKDIVIYDTDGRMLLKKFVGKYCCASLNESVVAVFKSSEIIVFDIMTGLKLKCFVNKYYQPFLVISPVKNIIIFSRRDVKKDRLIAFNINTGKKLWNFEIPIPYREYGGCKTVMDIYGTLLIVCLDRGINDDDVSLTMTYVISMENGNVVSENSYNDLHYMGKHFYVSHSQPYKLFV